MNKGSHNSRMGSVAQNLARVRETIEKAAARSGRPPGCVCLVAVTKTKPVQMIEEAVAAGHLDFGENYAQELRDKIKAATVPGIRWHFIGHLQKNKVKYVAGKVFEIHSLDSMALANEIDKRAQRAGVVARVFLEINLGGEAAKKGIEEQKAVAMIESARDFKNIEVVGLMTMPPYFSDPEKARPYYRRLRELRDEIRVRINEEEALPELSMGLSNDFEAAVEEGATRVRVGTAIFGERGL